MASTYLAFLTQICRPWCAVHLPKQTGQSPRWIEHRSLTNLQQRLVKTGGRLMKRAQYYWLLLAESQLTRRLFEARVRRIWALPVSAGQAFRRKS